MNPHTLSQKAIRKETSPSCIDCGIKVSTNKVKRCMKCFGISKRGENAYQYKGGKSKCISCNGLTTQYTTKFCR